MKSLQDLSLTRHDRILNYVKTLDSHVKIRQKSDVQLKDEIIELIQVKVKQVRGVIVVQNICYVGAYFSFLGLFFPESVLLSKLSILIGRIVSITGTAVFFVGIFLTMRLKELYYEDLTLLTSHLISIYDKHHNYEKDIFKNRNTYKVFLDFFKRRGF